jgi:nucleotide-binding universal stress UspA family protein
MTIRGTFRKGKSYIVHPTDFQLAARRAFFHAVKLAGVLDRQLKIVHVIKTPVDRHGVARHSRYLHSLRTSALLALGRLTRTAKEAGASAAPLLLYGEPSLSILHTVKQTGASLVVMGTEGRTGWDRLRIGSTAETLTRKAPCPVLSVHAGLAGDLPRHAARVRLRRLLLATDFSPYADAALRLLCDLAVKFDASVSVFHASGRSSERKHAELLVAKRIATLRHHQIEAEGLCVVGDTVEAIFAQAAAWRADLIAVGTRQARGLSRLTLGSVAEALLKRAGCPVLTVGRTSLHG